MVDVVVNHVAATSSSTFTPSDSYGPFAAQADYHPFCWIEDYSNQTQVEQCWLGDSSVALPDLNTQSSTVRDYWNGWVKDLVSNYSVDAIRIGTLTAWKYGTNNKTRSSTSKRTSSLVSSRPRTYGTSERSSRVEQTMSLHTKRTLRSTLST
jgi:hypothetical protein